MTPRLGTWLVCCVTLYLLVSICDGQFSRPFPLQNQIQQDRAKNVAKGSCPEKNGRFPVSSQCDAYIECIDGVPEEKLCPEGLVFNPDARFNYPCGYPIDVSCEGRPGLQASQATEECPHQFGYFKVGDKSNCGQFINCADGKAYLFTCPEGLAYNPENYRCDWPDQVPDCDAEAYLGFSCPNEKNLPVGDIRFFRSPIDCQRYYICVNGRPRLMNCGDGYAFDDVTNTCEDIKNVTGCSQQNRQGSQQGFQQNRQNSQQGFQQNRQQQNYQQNRQNSQQGFQQNRQQSFQQNSQQQNSQLNQQQGFQQNRQQTFPQGRQQYNLG